MTDNTYQPTQLQVSKDETMTLRFRNTGAGTHEGNMGNSSTPTSSAEEVGVEPGKTSKLTTFSESGAVLIGCHEPGHWEAGMKATITVT